MTAVTDILKSKQEAGVHAIAPTASVFDALQLMVMSEDGKLLGLISIGDLVKGIISEQKFVIEQLEHYITGWRG